MPPNETNDEFLKRQNGYVIDTINEAQDFILSMYGEYCEAARILRENKLRARVDMPEARAEVLANLLYFQCFTSKSWNAFMIFAIS